MVNWMRSNKWYLLLFTFLVLISYTNSLPNGFVSDDRGVVINANSLSYAFSEPLTSLRPLLNFFIFKIVGLHPFAFRLINVAFHIGITWLIYALVSKLTKGYVAIVAASLFAVHPILVESITWISGGVYVQYAFFFLLSFLLYLHSENRKKYVASVITFVLSLLSSQNAVVLPLIFPLFEFVFGDLKKNWKKSIPYFIISGIYAMLYFFSELGQRAEALTSASFGGEKVFYNPLIQVPVAITSYLELMFWPDMLTLYHSETIYTTMQYILRLGIFIAVVAGVIFSLKYTRVILFWFLFFVITLIPTLNPLGLTWIVAERYVYLGTLGIVVLAALPLSAVVKRKTLKSFVYAAVAILVIVLSIRTMVRNTDWQSEDTLWLSAARTSPSSPQNHNNLGDLYGRRGDRESAIAEFKEAIRLKPNYADAHHNLGNAYVEMGKIDEAIESYQKAISFNPHLLPSYQNLAAIYVNLEKYVLAEDYAKKAIEVNPNDLNLKINLGIVYFKAGKKDEAREQILKVLSLDPTNQRAKEVLSAIK